MGTIDYKNMTQAQVEQHAAEQKAAANEAAWQEIIDHYSIHVTPYGRNDGNRNMVESYCNGEMTLTKFKFLVENPPEGFTLVWSDEKTLKTELINEIFEHSSRDGAVPEHSKSSMAGWSLRQLRNRLDEVIRREYFSQFSADTLKVAVAEQRTKESKAQFYFDANGQRWPRLISVTVPPGHTTAWSTTEFLRQCVKAGFVPALKHYVSKYGAEQVNNFLNS